MNEAVHRLKSPARRRPGLAQVSAVLAALLLPMLQFASGPLHARDKPALSALPGGQPSSALFVGNSFFYYNNGIDLEVSRLIRAGDPRAAFRATMVTISGAGIDWHDIAGYFRPNAIGRYSFRDDNTVEFNTPGKKLFDVAILMDCSLCPVHPVLGQQFPAAVRDGAAAVRKHGTEPVLFMTWAYADRPEMTALLARAYTDAGNANRAIVVPAGLAFARSMAKRPRLALHAADKRHPSPAGTYLAAATIYAVLTGRSPVGLAYTSTLDRWTAAFLQGIAWETVTEYFGK
jgi:hypothetical protein